MLIFKCLSLMYPLFSKKQKVSLGVLRIVRNEGLGKKSQCEVWMSCMIMTLDNDLYSTSDFIALFTAPWAMTFNSKEPKSCYFYSYLSSLEERMIANYQTFQIIPFIYMFIKIYRMYNILNAYTILWKRYKFKREALVAQW